MSTSLYFANVGGHAINVGDISTVSPARADQLHPSAVNPAHGSRVTFRSKGTYLFIPDLTPDQFMDLLSESVNLALPD